MFEPTDLGKIRRSCAAASELLQQLAVDDRVLRTYHAWVKAMLSPQPAEAIDLVTRLVRDELQTSFLWLPPAVHLMFVLWTRDLAINQPRTVPAFSVDARAAVQVAIAPGRGPRSTLRRHVGWFYQAEIQQPRIRVADLWRAAQRENDPMLNRRTVEKAIDRVREWLTVELLTWADVDTMLAALDAQVGKIAIH